MQATLGLERSAHGVPIQPSLGGDVSKRQHHAFFHGFQAADVEAGVGVGQQRRHIGCTLPQCVLHVALGLAGFTREGELDVDEVFGQVLQRAKVRQLGRRACPKEQHEFAALELARLPQTPPPLGHGAHGGAAGAGANHDDVALGVIGHQEAGTEGANDLHLVAHLEVAHVVAAHTAHRVALVVFQHALDGERQVVVPGPLAIAGAGNRVLTGVMRLAVGIRTRRDDADALAFQYRKGQIAKVQHHMVGVVVLAHFRHPEVARDGGFNGLLLCLRSVQVGVRMRGRPGRHGRTVLRAVEGGLGVGRIHATGRSHNRLSRDLGRGIAGSSSLLLELGGRQFGWQYIPAQLLLQGIGLGLDHPPVVVNAAGGAGRNAVVTPVANIDVNDVIARIVGNGLHRADGFAGVAADADFGIDDVLLDDLGVGQVHGLSPRLTRNLVRGIEKT